MSKDYVWSNKKLADIYIELASITVDELPEEDFQIYATELKRVDSLINDLSNSLEQALDENEMLKGRILDLAGKVR